MRMMTSHPLLTGQGVGAGGPSVAGAGDGGEPSQRTQSPSIAFLLSVEGSLTPGRGSLLRWGRIVLTRGGAPTGCRMSPDNVVKGGDADRVRLVGQIRRDLIWGLRIQTSTSLRTLHHLDCRKLTSHQRRRASAVSKA